MSENPLRLPKESLGHRSSALDDQIHCWPSDYWRTRYALVDRLLPRVERPLELTFEDLSAFTASPTEKRLKVCIATEDFVGPVNNGGIGTTYTHLAYLLAREGHDVTVAYLRGEHAERESIQHWVDFYAEHKIRFLPVPDKRAYQFLNADRWARPSLVMLDFLMEEHFDLVHVSEWRGSGFYSLLAKRLGLGLETTTFAVKTSSPWLWNRDYGQEAVTNLPDIFKIVMERRSVELADMVIGGSAHLLRWMGSQGYQLPAGRTHVQPNVVVMKDFRGDSPERPPHVVDGKIKELVFFGRLEARKGLEIFCEAVSLLDRDGLVEKVSFCGKPGARLPSHPSLETPDYIREVTSAWNAEIEIHTNFDSNAVCDYLCRRPCVAVMPSLIENSSLAVYETTQYRIPFIASDVGGNAEIVHPDDGARVLFQPRPYPLYHKLVDIARNGLERARPSFDNTENLEVWKAFHHGMAQRPPEPPKADLATPPVSAVVMLRRTGAQAMPLLRSLAEQDIDGLEIVLVHDETQTLHDEVAAWIEHAGARIALRRVDVGLFESDAVALREASAAASHEFLLLGYEGGRLDPTAARMLSRAAALGGLDVVTGFVGECGESFAADTPVPTAVVTPLGPDVSYDIFDRTVLKPDFLIAKSALATLGGLSDEYKLGGGYGELLLSAKCHGLLVDVVPKVLSLRFNIQDAESPEYSEVQRELWRTLRPYADSLPQAVKPMLMGLAGIAPRFTDMTERIAKVNRDRAQLLEQRDRWKARAEKAQEQLKAAPKTAAKAAPVGGKPDKTPAAGRPELVKPTPADAVLFSAVRGGILDVADGVIIGWARGADDQPVEVDILVNGVSIGTAISDVKLSPFLKLSPVLQKRGFTFDLGRIYQDAEAAFSVDVVAGSKKTPIVQDMQVYPPTTTLEQTSHEGYCENNNAGLIRGWIWRRDAPDEQVDVAFYQNGVLWRIETADVFRRDLVAARRGTGEYGFQVPIPSTWRDDGPRTVDVRLAGSGLRLRRGPLKIMGGTVITSS